MIFRKRFIFISHKLVPETHQRLIVDVDFLNQCSFSVWFFYCPFSLAVVLFYEVDLNEAQRIYDHNKVDV